MMYPKAKVASVAALLGILFIPMAISLGIWFTYENDSEGELEVFVAQPNFDPYHKFESMSQSQQTDVLLRIMSEGLADRQGSGAQTPLLALAPETFTSDVVLGNLEQSPTLQSIRFWQMLHPGVSVLLGASTHEYIYQRSRPSWTARHLRDDAWHQGRNSAIMMRADGTDEIFHKSKLVVGVEMTPYPALFSRIDDMLGGVMGRDIGQEKVTVLNAAPQTPIGSIICYESIYGEYCTGYVKAGAKALAVITNDAWWGNTPGYRQHCSYSSLRAIETRRDIVRCGNTGISCLIDQRGRILERTPWWEEAGLRGSICLSSRETFFVQFGDMVGRACVFVFALLFMALVAGSVKSRRG